MKMVEFQGSSEEGELGVIGAPVKKPLRPTRIEEVSRKMRDTAGGTPALPSEEAASSFFFHFEKHEFDILKSKSYLAVMKTISVREMKANWSAVEAQVREGETFEVVNRGRPSVRISPALPRKILVWENHLETAIPNAGRPAEETVAADREGRW